MKRFSYIRKWEEPWFRQLSPVLKCLWLYLCERCDPAGIIDFDPGLASFQVGAPVTREDLKQFGDRVVELPNGRMYLPGYIELQFVRLCPTSSFHKAVYRSLAENGLEVPGDSKRKSESASESPSEALPEGLPEALKHKHTHKHKHTEEEVDPDGQKVQAKIPPVLAGLPDFSAEWDHFVRHRKSIGRKMTSRARELLLGKLAERPEKAVEALQTAQMRGWQGFEWEWMDNAQRQPSGSAPPHGFTNGSLRPGAPVVAANGTPIRPVYTI